MTARDDQSIVVVIDDDAPDRVLGYACFGKTPMTDATYDLYWLVVAEAARGRGIGANLGGLAGADALCRQRATAVGRGDRLWRAYLSAPPSPDVPAVNARDRIGRGPWVNARGVQIAASVEQLHSETVNLTIETALTEKGGIVAPQRHDILTGSNPDGTLVTSGDATCSGWTSHREGMAMVGHHNRYGGGRGDSWNSAHLSRGCSQTALRASLGDGLLYCFAAD